MTASDQFNATAFFGGIIQRCKVGINFDGTSRNFTIDNVDFEMNETCLLNGQLKNLTVKNCYIEGNDTFLSLNKGHINSVINIEKCYFWSDATENGWLAKLFATTNLDVEPSILMIKNCDIELANNTKNKIPFSFNVGQGENCGSYDCVCLLENYFLRFPSTNINYFELFDKTNAPIYGTLANRLPVKTDLPIAQQDGLVWRIQNFSNLAYAYSRRYHLHGRYEIESTGTKYVNLNYPNDFLKRDSNNNGYINAVAIYDDGTRSAIIGTATNEYIQFSGIDSEKNLTGMIIDGEY